MLVGPKTLYQGTVFGTRVLESWVLGPFGICFGGPRVEEEVALEMRVFSFKTMRQMTNVEGMGGAHTSRLGDDDVRK